MNPKIITFLTLFAVLLGCVVSGVAADEPSIKLHFYDGSSRWWIAVDPRNEIYNTVQIELKEAGESSWVTMMYNEGWGYFHLPSTSGRGFALPLTFRLTSDNGETINAVVYRIASNNIVDTKVQYDNGAPQPTVTPVEPTQVPTPANTEAPTQPPSPTVPAATPAPTVPAATPAPTEPAATPAPTEPATQAPTTRPTTAPTTRPTTAPTTRPTTAPTTRPTEPATQAPTPKPTQPATQAPTQPPTPKPTQPATQAPTQPPTPKPTQPATPAPTQPPTPKPTTAPTQPPSTDLCAIVPVSTEPLKVLVPLYVYPGAAWDTLITAANNGVKIIAIINPNSGPNANGPDASYTNYMRRFTAAGIEMVGYVHTLWGARSIDTVNAEIGTYASKYPGVTGIFFDEAATEANAIPFYTTAYNTVKSKGFVHSILNPGVQPDRGYLDISSNIVIFENYASSLSSASYSSWVKCAPSASAKAGYQYKFSAIIHTASLSDMPSLMARTRALGMGLVYVTDGPGGCCTYNYLATYFAAEANAVKAINS